jgi:hypothetical protein
MLDIGERTRIESRFVTGVSTRGAIALYKASQVEAAFSGRDYVLPEDVLMVAPHVLSHRLSSGGLAKSADAGAFLRRSRPDARSLETIVMFVTRCSLCGGGADRISSLRNPLDFVRYGSMRPAVSVDPARASK